MKDALRDIIFVHLHRVINFRSSANNKTKTQKETMFIQMLEGLHQEEAELLLGMKNKTLNKSYKGLTSALVREAFNWDENFMQNENK